MRRPLWRWRRDFRPRARERRTPHLLPLPLSLSLSLRPLLSRSNLPKPWVRVQIIAPDTNQAALPLAAFDPVRHHDGDIHAHSFLPRLAASVRADEVRSIDPNLVDEFGADAVDGRLEGFAEGGWHLARCDGDAAQIRHLVRLDLEFLAAVRASAGLQDEMERVFCIDLQAADLGRMRVERLGDGAGFAAIAVQRQAAQFSGRDIDGIPFEDDGGLCGIAAAEDGRRGSALAEGAEDVRLKLVEFAGGFGFGLEVAGDGDVDDAAGRNVGGEEDGGELDLGSC